MLGENCPVATPTTEHSGMSLNEQSDTPGENLAPVRPEPSVEPSAEFQQTSSPTRGRAREGDFSSIGGPALVLIQAQVQS